MDGLSAARRRRRRTAASILSIFCMLGAMGAAASPADGPADGIVIVRAQTVTRALRAYGQIAPTTILPVRAVIPGTLRGLRVVPGDVVTIGESLARIRGPRMRSLLTVREQALRSAQAREEAAQQTLAIVRRELANQLATRQAVDAARRDWIVARAAVRSADAQLREARALQTIRAPDTGAVIAVPAADGEQTAAGETILTLLPAGKLWIRAPYYGADAARLHVGMTGRFQPSGAAGAIPVRVVAVASSAAVDGSRSVGLLPTAVAPPAWWGNGQWGTVEIDGPSSRMVAVPTSALILDRGRWWVLVRTAQGDEPREVTPGPVRGWRTWIASGLQAGQQVVVRNAFLEYHRDVAASFQPPD